MAASTSQKMKFPLRGSGSARGPVTLTGEFTLGAAGAVASAAGFSSNITGTAGSANTTIKVAAKTGRYTIGLDRKYKVVRPVAGHIIGAADTAFGANAAAVQFRNRNQGASASPSSFDVQLVLTGTDTDGASGYVVTWVCWVDEL